MGSGVGSATAKVGIKNLPESINYIWEEYIADSKNNSLLSYEMNQKTLTYLNKSLAFDYLIKGDQNKNRFLPLYIIVFPLTYIFEFCFVTDIPLQSFELIVLFALSFAYNIDPSATHIPYCLLFNILEFSIFTVDSVYSASPFPLFSSVFDKLIVALD